MTVYQPSQNNKDIIKYIIRLASGLVIMIMHYSSASSRIRHAAVIADVEYKKPSCLKSTTLHEFERNHECVCLGATNEIEEQNPKWVRKKK